MAAEALRQTENDVNAATEALNERPELILSAIQDRDFDPTQITKDMVSQVAAMGFDIEDAKKALVHAKGVLGDAVDALASGKRLSPVPKRHKKVIAMFFGLGITHRMHQNIDLSYMFSGVGP